MAGRRRAFRDSFKLDRGREAEDQGTRLCGQEARSLPLHLRVRHLRSRRHRRRVSSSRSVRRRRGGRTLNWVMPSRMKPMSAPIWKSTQKIAQTARAPSRQSYGGKGGREEAHRGRG